MEYIHVKNLEKYHPGYKDRQLQWAKIYINMADGDPDTELITNEIDWARFIKIILLELRAQKPLPNLDEFWIRKGFDLKRRPMSLTLQMLHNFLITVTKNTQVRYESVTQIREDKNKKREDKEGFPEILYKVYKTRIRPGAKSDAIRNINALLRAGVELTTLRAAVDNYAGFVERKKVEIEYRIQANNFFGKARRFEDFANGIPESDKERADRIIAEIGEK